MNRSSKTKPLSEQAKNTNYQRLFYGSHSQQFVDVHFPESGTEKLPTMILIHGGCWTEAIGDLSYLNPIAMDLMQKGFATINIEYRDVEEEGGWTGTFDDVVNAVDGVADLRKVLPLDLDNLILLGHSAGAHLALWGASRAGIPAGDPLYQSKPLLPK